MINICSATKLISEKEKFLQIIKSGYTHIRINFSHIKNADADEILDFTKENCPNIKIVQDLQGPKIRIGNIDDTYKLEKYKPFIFYKEGEVIKSDKSLPIIPIFFEDYKLLKNTKRFVISNRRHKSNISVLETKEYDWGTMFTCISDSECVFRAKKGINAIGFDRTNIKLSQKDKENILWGLKNKVDVIILSFVSTPQQLIELKSYIKEKSSYMPMIWAKIECKDGITNAAEILKECDGFMIGRGDLCVEIPLIELPKAQSELIRLCNSSSKECIVATHLFNNYEYGIDISDITAIYHMIEMGATGFMMVDEVIFSKNPVKISKDFYNIIFTYGGN